MRKKRTIQILLLITIFIFYRQESYLNETVKLVIVALYSLFAIYFSTINILDKNRVVEIKIMNYSVSGLLDFLWFLIGSLVLYGNRNEFSLMIIIMFTFLLFYFVSLVKIRKVIK